MKPFSDNIVFWDTEFSSLNPYKGEILSIGMVKPDGSELYLELEHKDHVDPWVTENVIPKLNQPKLSRAAALSEITNFLGSSKPYLVCYVNQFDSIYLYKLLGAENSTKEYPFYWIQIDFASMLFANNIDPKRFNTKDPNSLAKELGIDASKYREHHALDDAKLLKDIYQKLCT